MGKISKHSWSKGAQTHGMSYTTHQRSNATKIVEVQAPFLHGEAKKVQAASLQDETMKQGGDVAAATGDLKTIREAYVAALPTMASFTCGEGVLEEVTLILSFLHGSDSDAAVFNEAATGEVVDRCAETGAKIITQIMRDHSEMLTRACTRVQDGRSLLGGLSQLQLHPQERRQAQVARACGVRGCDPQSAGRPHPRRAVPRRRVHARGRHPVLHVPGVRPRADLQADAAVCCTRTAATRAR